MMQFFMGSIMAVAAERLVDEYVFKEGSVFKKHPLLTMLVAMFIIQKIVILSTSYVNNRY